MDGLESIDAEQEKIAFTFNDAEVNEEMLSNITRDSIEKLGWKLEKQGAVISPAGIYVRRNQGIGRQ